VPAEHLIEELWHGRPPAGASSTLPTYVSRLRSALGPGVTISSGATGYAVEALLEQVDARCFERLAAEGRAALARGADHRAAERLHAALGLWRGRPFGELGDEGMLRREADRLEEVRLLAVEDRIDAELALGRARELVDELEALVQEHPYRERVWRQLMLALYRAERQADALAAYRRAREILDDELGIEPGDDMKRLEQAILRRAVDEVELPEERHNLPAPLTSFIGREAELAEIERLLGGARLVTLTGVGGVGKTRLALEAARRALPDFSNGISFVDLSAIGDAGSVVPRVAATLDVHEQTDRELLELVCDLARERELLLVLDNCEHVRDESAQLAYAVLSASPRTQILATSREPLGAPGEAQYSVGPLVLPPPNAEAEDLRSSEAVQLFLERARAVRPQLGDDPRAVAAAARICADLDGLPLAIELAAGRAKALSLDDIANRLADRFRFLVSWRRLAAARHRTLRETMDWSWELLSGDEQALLAGLSVFAGGFTLPAAAAVCVEGEEQRALDLVERLVDASLVTPEERDGETRCRLLETVRQYAGERLAKTADREVMGLRHVAWCLALAEEAEPQLTGDGQTHWLGVLDAERENFAAAFECLAATGDGEGRLRLAIALSRFWYVRGYLAEGRRRLREATADSGAADPVLRRRALTAAASLALLQGDYDDALAVAEEALLIAQGLGDERYEANALSNLGAIALAAGHHERAGELLEEAVALARRAEDDRIAALAINNLGDLALTLGDYARAEPLFEESLALLRSRGDTANIARSLFNLGAVALQLGRLGDSNARLREAVTFAEQAGDKEDIAWCLEGFAALAAAEGRGEEAARLLGAASALLNEMDAEFKPFERQLHDATEDAAVRLLGERAFGEAEREGAAMALADAIASALV